MAMLKVHKRRRWMCADVYKSFPILKNCYGKSVKEVRAILSADGQTDNNLFDLWLILDLWDIKPKARKYNDGISN